MESDTSPWAGERMPDLYTVISVYYIAQRYSNNTITERSLCELYVRDIVCWHTRRRSACQILWSWVIMNMARETGAIEPLRKDLTVVLVQ